MQRPLNGFRSSTTGKLAKTLCGPPMWKMGFLRTWVSGITEYCVKHGIGLEDLTILCRLKPMSVRVYGRCNNTRTLISQFISNLDLLFLPLLLFTLVSGSLMTALWGRILLKYKLKWYLYRYGHGQTHLERIFILTGNDDVTFHNFHTFNPGKFHRTLQSPFFLKDRQKHLVNVNDCGLSE